MSSIKCGNCTKTHESVHEVRACFGLAPVASGTQSETVAGGREFEAAVTAQIAREQADPEGHEAYAKTVGLPMASQKQVDYLLGLQMQRADENDHLGRLDYEAMTKKEASTAIEFLLKQPKQQAAPKAAAAPETDPEDGIYIVERPNHEPADIFKVYKMVHGSGRQGVKHLHIVGDQKTGSFVYKGLASKHLPTVARKMTLEEAKAFGRIYGFCVRCGATLTDETSIANGIGPVCGAKGW